MLRRLVVVLSVAAIAASASAAPLRLPELPIPEDNPMTPAKIALGDKLFHDDRFSTTGDVSCSTCHERDKGFTDSPLSTSEGILSLTGTRNSPTTTNAAYFKTFFWDGRSPSLDMFLNEGRCVSCHVIERDHALFTDHRFHNIGVGINDIQDRIPEAVDSFLAALARGAEVDETVLSEKLASELGRFAVSEMFDDLGAFKTPTLRNVAATAPYMHDGSLATLKEVMDHYNNGGVTNEGDPFNDFLSGGILPLDLTDEQVADLVLFMEALTSPEYEALAEAADASGLD